VLRDERESELLYEDRALGDEGSRSHLAKFAFGAKVRCEILLDHFNHELLSEPCVVPRNFRK
jgi:hypothetical protein